ncbi:MAG: hypothetical protein WEG40_15790 [Candidatus Rokuibacteriota bacterium]
MSCSTSSTGIGHEHADELDELLLAVGEIARVLAGEPLELDELQQLPGPALRLRVPGGRDHQQVLERGQLREDPDHLEGAAEAQVEDLVRLQALDPPALLDHAAGLEDGRHRAMATEVRRFLDGFVT